MTNRNLLLGRSRPIEKLTREEIAALDKATVPPAPLRPPDGLVFLAALAVGAPGDVVDELPAPVAALADVAAGHGFLRG